MATPPEYTCATCRLYYAVQPELDPTHECHRFPPTVTLITTLDPDHPQGMTVRKLVAFPFVEPHWSCAEQEEACP